MLIIAIPKSASTSLLQTIGRVHYLPSKQVMHSDLPVPGGFTALGRIHSDVREYTEEHITEFTAADRFHKQHIPPTENNCAMLGNTPRVVLLREPLEVIEAYWRAFKKGVIKGRPEFAGITSSEEWLERATSIGLLNELERFHEGWTTSDPSMTCVITYKDLLDQPRQTINRIEEFFKLPVTRCDIELARARYTRDSAVVTVASRLAGRARSLSARAARLLLPRRGD